MEVRRKGRPVNKSAPTPNPTQPTFVYEDFDRSPYSAPAYAIFLAEFLLCGKLVVGFEFT
jgi:hypothetical protein